MLLNTGTDAETQEMSVGQSVRTGMSKVIDKVKDMLLG